MKRTCSCNAIRTAMILVLAVLFSGSEAAAQGFLKFYPRAQPAEGGNLYSHQFQVRETVDGYNIVGETPENHALDYVRQFSIRQTNANGIETQAAVHHDLQAPQYAYTGFNHQIIVSGEPVDTGHIRLIKHSIDGNLLWDKTVEIPIRIGPITDVKVSETGEIFVFLFSYPNPLPVSQTATTTIAKLDTEGNLLWISNQSNYYLDAILNPGDMITPASDGGCYLHYGQVEYYVVSRVAANGDVLWRDSSFISLSEAFIINKRSTETAGGGFLLSCIPSSNYNPAFLKYYDANGQIVWQHQSLNNTLELFNFFVGTLIGTSDGGVVAVGQAYEQNHAGIQAARFSASGELLWKRRYDDLDNQPQPYMTFTGGTQTADGGFAIAGVWNDKDMLLKIDANGKLHSNMIVGTVAGDVNVDCLVDQNDIALPNTVLRSTGSNTDFWAVSGTDGRFEFQADPGDYVLKVQPPSYLWQPCVDSLIVSFPDTGLVKTADFALQAIADCPMMTVDVITPRLRRCFANYVAVNYCNLGSLEAVNAVVTITLDNGLDFNSSSIPGTQNGQEISFPLGNVAAGFCGSFNFLVTPNCDSTQLDDTKCISAHVTPDSICGSAPNWSGATIEVAAECQGDVINFQIKNTGDATSGQLKYYIIEDHVIMMTVPFQLDGGGVKNVTQPVNGHTIRMICQQEPGHPVAGTPSVAIEACGTALHNQGFLNQFPNQTGSPFDAIVCRTIIGSFDPNDKHATPEGVGNQHFIENNTDLEYLINFQNTGTDTAFRVIILDTLSAQLDPFTISGVAADNRLEWSLLEGNVIRFVFNDILLPDSNTNEAASHGFVRFKIKQTQDLPDGLLITNRAAIYFDFNPPVITNTVFHTIGREFLETTATNNPAGKTADKVLLSPNPATEAVSVILKDREISSGSCRVLDCFGKTVAVQRFNSPAFEIKRNGMSPGIYLLEISSDQDAGQKFVQKLIWK